MKKVHIVEKFNTTIGLVLKTDDKRLFKIGDTIECDDKNKYVIKGINMGTMPNNIGMVSLIVN